MKDTIYPIDIATGEYVQGIQMTDEEERKRRKKYWELRNAKELRRIDHGPLGKFYLSACRSECSMFPTLPQNDFGIMSAVGTLPRNVMGLWLCKARFSVASRNTLPSGLPSFTSNLCKNSTGQHRRANRAVLVVYSSFWHLLTWSITFYAATQRRQIYPEWPP